MGADIDRETVTFSVDIGEKRRPNQSKNIRPPKSIDIRLSTMFSQGKDAKNSQNEHFEANFCSTCSGSSAFIFHSYLCGDREISV